MRAPWSFVPMLFPLAAIVAGTLIDYAGLPLWTLALFLAATAVAAFMRRRAVAVMLLMVGVCFLSARVRHPAVLPSAYEGRTAVYSGVVERYGEGLTTMIADLRVDSIDGRRVAPFMLHANVPGATMPGKVNDRVRVNCRASAQPIRIDLPDEIDPASIRGMAYTFASSDSFAFVCHEPGPVRALRRMRDRVVDRIYSSPIEPSTAAFVSAVLTGQADDLLDTERQQFAEAGLSHILALSGLHVSIIAWMIGLVLYPLFPCRHSRPRVAITIAALWVFAVATGLSPSVTRSVIMASVVLLGLMLHRRHSPFNSLFLAAAIILVADPSSLFSPAFQLSFAAVAGILALVVPVSAMPRGRRKLAALIILFGVPVAAVVSTSLISLYYFHTLPLHFLGANVCLSYLMPPMMVASVLTVLTAHPWPAAMADALYSAICAVADFFSSLPSPRFSIYPTAWAVTIGCLALAFVALAAVRRRGAFAIMALMTVVLAFGVEIMAEPEMESEPAAYFLRSRQSFDVAVPDGRRLIISTTAMRHEYADIADMARFRFSRYMGRRGIDTLIVTDDFRTGRVRRHADTLEVGERRFCLLGTDHTRLPGGWHGVVVAPSRFKGDIVGAIEGSAVDTVMIAADMNPRRARRYLRELGEAGISAIDLRKEPMRLSSDVILECPVGK